MKNILEADLLPYFSVLLMLDSNTSKKSFLQWQKSNESRKSAIDATFKCILDDIEITFDAVLNNHGILLS